MIADAIGEILQMDLSGLAVIDPLQPASALALNTAINEVVADRANRSTGMEPGAAGPVNPFDHVNLGQSENDVLPVATYIACVELLKDKLNPALQLLADELQKKSAKFDGVVKPARISLQEKTPIRLGQEFAGWAVQAKNAVRRINYAIRVLAELPIGGTYVGTGLNTHPDFAAGMCRKISEATGIEFRVSSDHVQAQATLDILNEAGGILQTTALSLSKMATDLRLLMSGPVSGFGELIETPAVPNGGVLPAITPVDICDMVIASGSRVVGNCATLTHLSADCQLEKPAVPPVAVQAILESIHILTCSVQTLTEKCVKVLDADSQRCNASASKPAALALVPYIGSQRAEAIAREAMRTRRPVREIAMEKGVLGDHELMQVLDSLGMTNPRPHLREQL